MKFGKRLQAEASRRPEWAQYYVDYKRLKKATKLDIKNEGVRSASNMLATTPLGGLRCRASPPRVSWRKLGRFGSIWGQYAVFGRIMACFSVNRDKIRHVLPYQA